MDIFDKATVLVEGKYNLVTPEVMARAILLGSVVTVCDADTGEMVSGMVETFFRKAGAWARIIMFDELGMFRAVTTPLFDVSE